MRVISSVDELSGELRSDFVLFIGSAVSGVSEPRVPMSPRFKAAVLNALEKRCSQNIYFDALVRTYLNALNGNHYRAITDTTKFEEFIWDIERSSSRSARDELLSAVYSCADEEFGVNHAAIARLLKSRRALACLTTNFDNAIEHAMGGVRRYIFPYDPADPPHLPTADEEPVLIKLHGDATLKNCVAISTDLFTARQAENHRYLRTLLANRDVLVAGYSGDGDIDISPHLFASSARLFWICEVAERAHREAEFAVVTDLSAGIGAGNLLTALAGLDVFAGRERDWLTPLTNWSNTAAIQPSRLVVALTSWRTAQPPLHLYYAKPSGSRQGDLTAKGWALVYAKAYLTALQAFHSGLADSTCESEMLDYHRGIGFCMWRLGLFTAAQRHFKVAISLGTNTPELSSSRRLFLEVSRDRLAAIPGMRWRRREYRRSRLAKYVGALTKAPREGSSDWILSALVIADLRRLIGRKVTSDEIEVLFKAAMNSELYETAEAVAEVWVALSPRSGLAALGQSYKKLRETRHNNYLFKIRYFRLDHFVLRHVPFASRSVFILVAFLKTALMEARVIRWRIRWFSLKRGWQPGTDAMIDTDFG